MAKEIISRATWRRLKTKNREDFNAFLQDFGCEIYNDGCRDTAVGTVTALRDEFGFGTQRIARAIKKQDAVIAAINLKEFSAADAVNELRKEGLHIKADFEWTYDKEAK